MAPYIDKDHLSDEDLDEAIRGLWRWLARSLRPLVLSLIILIGFMQTRLGLTASVAAGLLVLLVYSSGLGRRRIEQVAVAAFLLTLLYWTDLVPMQRWHASGLAAIDRLLSTSAVDP